MMDSPKRPVLLCILDGWGHRPEADNNAFALANTPRLDKLLTDAPHALLRTSGTSVGLPDGQMGNSEVGHMNLGSGRIVLQGLPKIDAAVEDGTLGDEAPLQSLIAKLKKTGGTCHVMGLMSPGGVHSHQNHILALCRILSEADIKVAVHAFMDGRDTPPSSGRDFLKTFETAISPLPGVEVATVSGRYYAMDRDKRWERIALAYEVLVEGQGPHADSADAAMAASYDSDITDEFVKPVCIGDYTGMQDGDGFIMANFRADRAREILTALVDPAFDGFPRPRLVDFSARLGMVEYAAALDEYMDTLFPSEVVPDTLGEVVADAGLRQLRIAETEKYAHVTFFFNGGVESVYDGEDRILVPSPKVATYDLAPEMSANEVTDKLVDAIRGKKYDLIVCNFANPDMVGHTGVLSAAITAMETIDSCIGRITAALEQVGGCLLLTADHGNLEQMVDPETGEPHTAHTTLDVPVVLVGGPPASLSDGALSDVAPTVLQLMGLSQPATMTGHSLLRPASAKTGARMTQDAKRAQA